MQIKEIGAGLLALGFYGTMWAGAVAACAGLYVFVVCGCIGLGFSAFHFMLSHI